MVSDGVLGSSEGRALRAGAPDDHQREHRVAERDLAELHLLRLVEALPLLDVELGIVHSDGVIHLPGL